MRCEVKYLSETRKDGQTGLKNKGTRLEKTILIISVGQILGFIHCLDAHGGIFWGKEKEKRFPGPIKKKE